MKKAIFSILVALIVLACAGCGSTTAIPSPTPSSLQPSTLYTSPSPTPTPTPMPATEEPTETPEETPKPGVWVPDTQYGVNGESYEIDDNGNGYYQKNSQIVWKSIGSPVMQPDKDTIGYDKSVKINIDKWTFYFDTQHPIGYDNGIYGYPILRKDRNGHIVNLGISGFDIIPSKNYIYVNTNFSFGDLSHRETYRVSLDGKSRCYVGGDIFNLFVPDQGDYMYFSGGFGIYRTDMSFDKVEHISLQTNDIEKIESHVEPNDEFVEILYIKDEWIYFSVRAMNVSDGRDYFGSYKMKLSGGPAINTDIGVYSMDIPDKNPDDTDDTVE